MMQVQGELELVYTGAGTGRTSRWYAANDIDKVVLTSPSVAPLYWKPGLKQIPSYGKCRPVAGLPDNAGYDGVESFAGHTLLWRDSSIIWSDLNDTHNWIPIALTAASGRAELASSFTQPQVGGTSATVFLTEESGEFVAGQFVRIVANETNPSEISYSYYRVSSVASSSTSTFSINTEQAVPSGGDEVMLYTTSYLSVVEDGKLAVDGTATEATVVEGSRNLSVSYTLGGASSIIGALGESVTFPLSSFPFDLKVDDIISVGVEDSPGQDLYQVTAVGLTVIANRLGVGEAQKTAGLTYPYGGANPTVYVRFQPWIKVTNSSTTSIPIGPKMEISPVGAVKLVAQGLTGEIRAGLQVPSGAILETLDANEAGGVENVGNGINGPVFAIVKLADYVYILKKDSIQSMQYVGRDSGTFFIRGEIYDEGPMGRYAWCRIGEKSIIFWGAKGWMRYSGGQAIEDIGKAHWETAIAELDASRADEIVAFHYKPRNEVWFSYPVLGSRDTKVIVYNYDFNSITVDRYSGDLNGITAIGLVDWEIAPTWESLSSSERCNDASKRWYEYSDVGLKPYPVIGIVGDAGNERYGEDPDALVPRLLLFGRAVSRASNDDCAPAPIEAFADTPDHDFGDFATVKYVDTVRIGLHVPAKLAHPLKLKVKLGTRMNSDDDIVWSGHQTIEVSGNGNITSKVNIRASGRLVRVRFFSDDLDVQWSISSYSIYARAGSTY